MAQEIHELAIKIASNVDGLERDQIRAERALLNTSRRLKQQADTFGMSRQAARIYSLEQRGVREEVVASARAANQQVEALRRQQAANEQVENILRRSQTATERLTQEQQELTAAHRRGDLATDKYRAGMASLNRQMGRLTPRVNAGNVAMGAFGGGTVSATGALSAIGPAGLVAATGLAAVTKAASEGIQVLADLAEESAEFDRKFTRSIALAGNVSAETQAQMIEAATSAAVYTGSLTKQAEAYQFLFAAGLDNEQAMASQLQVTKFATAGNFDLATATDLATDAQSALGLKSAEAVEHQENLARVTDVLAKAYTDSNATMEQFGVGVTNRAGPSYRLAGKGIEELVAVLEVYADQGIKGEKASTKADIALREINRSARDNAEAWAQAGVAVFDANEKFRHMADVVADLEDHLEGMTDKEREAAMATLGFTSESKQAVAALIGRSDAMRAYDAANRQAAGTVDRLANEGVTNLDKATNNLNLAWGELANDVGPAVNESLAEATNNLAEMIRSFEGVGESIDPVARDLASLVETMGELATARNELFPFLPDLQSSLESIPGMGIARANRNYQDYTDPSYQAALATGAYNPAVSAEMYRNAEALPYQGEIEAAQSELQRRRQPWEKEQSLILAEYEAAAQAAAAATGDHGAALAESSEAAERALGPGEEYLAQLREQIDTFGMSAEAAARYRLEQQNIPDAIREQIAAEQEKLAQMKESEQAAREIAKLAEQDQADRISRQEDLASQAAQIIESQKSDTQRLTDRQQELQQLVDEGLLTGQQAGTAFEQFAEQFQPQQATRSQLPSLITAGSAEDFAMRRRLLGDGLPSQDPQQEAVGVLKVIAGLMETLVNQDPPEVDVEEVTLS